MSGFWHSPPEGFELGPCIGGRAGATRVFAAREAGGRGCALKTLAPEAGREPVRVARFAREVEAHTRCSGVAGVAPARVADSLGAWLAIDWAHGGDLASALEHSAENRTRITDRAQSIIAQLLDALIAIHDRGIAHRDIKPSNILLDGDEVWLTDFGVAGQLETENGTPLWRALPPPHREIRAGTPPWAAPELSHALPAVMPASDIYSVAMLWHHLREAKVDRAAHRSHNTRLLDAMRAPDPAARPTAREARAMMR